MKKLLLMCMICFFFNSALAVKVASLYQAELPVSSQSQESRLEAAKEGFSQVLVKLTGDPQILKNPMIHDSLQKADYYVQEFGYSASTTSSSQYQIQIKYEPDDVNRLLRKAGVSYWGENRPLILVWLAVIDKQGAAEIISNEDPGDILSSMKQASKKAGIPLIFPFMDMADISHVSNEDVITMAIPVLKEAAKRYHPDAILIGKITSTESGYESQWQLVLKKNQWDWTIDDKSPHNVIEAIVTQISQALTKHYVIQLPNTSKLWVKLEVNNISQRNDLAELMQYLNQLTLVQQVRLSQVTGSAVELSILVNGSLVSFQQNAMVGQRLQLKAQDNMANRLTYEWVH